MPPVTDPDPAAELEKLRLQVEACTRCRLHSTRGSAVFGEGDPRARLMFVGEAPGYHEDKQGRPFVGAAGKLLSELLATIGLTREDVYITNVLKSRPPNNRDPQPDEIEACTPYLLSQIGIIRPKIICSLGNFATKLLSGEPTGITRAHGHPQVREAGGHTFYLYPIFHPAAALYTPSMLQILRDDFQRLPRLLQSHAPDPAGAAASPVDEAQRAAPSEAERSLPHDGSGGSGAADPDVRRSATAHPDPDQQLGLF